LIPNLKCHSQPTIYDIDQDGNLELIACRDWSKPIIWDLYTWSLDAMLPYDCWEPPAVADIDGDGYVEILACTSDNISIFNHNYQFIGSINLTNTGLYGMSMILAQDVDNDGLTELILNRVSTVYVYDTIAPSPTPRALSQFNFYSQHRGRSPYYVQYGPIAPIVKNENPINGATNQLLNPTLSAYICDYQYDLMDITFKTNASESWHEINSFNNVHDGTYSASTTEMDSFSTTYWWSIKATDSTGKSTEKFFKFKTKGIIQISNPTPANNAIGVEINPILSIEVEEYYGNLMTVTFMTNATGSWTTIGSNTSVPNGVYQQKPNNMNNYNKNYYWRVTCTSVKGEEIETYHFKTYNLPEMNWWNDDWIYVKEIKIDHTKVNAQQTNFPILINLPSDINLAAHAQPDGDDIVFTDANGNKLNHEIELYENNNGRLIAWVNIPTLSSTTDTKLYMYYGNNNCNNQQNPQNTWNNNYLMVHHMEESGNIYDSTSHALNAINHGTTTDSNGKIGNCRYFDDSSSDYYDFGASDMLNPGMNSWTITLWTKITYIKSYVMLRKLASNVGFHLSLYQKVDGVNYFYVNDTINETYKYWGTTWSDGIWHYLTIVINRNTNQLDMYLDGNLKNGGGQGNLTGLNNITSNSNFLLYGGADGRHDEFTISTTARNSSWIKTSYNNQNNPSSFYSIYPELTIPGIKPVISDENPKNGATEISLNPTLSIDVSHESGDLMNVTWLTNASGSWTVIGTNTYVTNGTYSCTNTYMINKDNTKYWWKVEVRDNHGEWTNRTYSFTTKFPNRAPTQNSPLLTSEFGTNSDYEDLICENQSTTDLDGDEVYNTYHWIRNGTSFLNLLLSFNTINNDLAKDYSGYNNNGIVTGATWYQNGIVGGAYSFAGTDSQDYITISDETNLHGGGTWTSITIEHWIYLEIDQTNTNTISKMSQQPETKSSYQIGIQNGSTENKLYGSVIIGNNNQITAVYNTPLIPGVWYYVVLTYKSGIGLKLYVNGIAAATVPGTGNIQTSNGQDLYIGCRYSTENFFDGKIDEVKIYPIALSTQQIYKNYLQTKDGYSSKSTIDAEETSRGDVWQCEITPSDGQIDGETKKSDFLTINKTPNLPSNPYPSHGATNVNINTILSWDCSDPDGYNLTYNIYFEKGDSTPDILVSSNQNETTYNPGTMAYSSTYYWKIVAKNEKGITINGTTWSFTTKAKQSGSSSSSGGSTNKYPIANASKSETTGILGVPINLDGSASIDPDGNIVSYNWIFGDENTGIGQTTTHIYSQVGEYIVKLTVTDNLGATNTNTIHVIITGIVYNQPTTPIITGQQNGICNITYTFTALSTDLDSEYIMYNFSWGDSSVYTTTLCPSGIAVSASHNWTNPGAYKINIKAYDKHLESNIANFTILIDAWWVNNIGYLIDINSDGIYDNFYSNETNNLTKSEKNSDGKYLINIDDDPQWDGFYQKEANTFTEFNASDEPIKEKEGFNPVYIFIIVIILIISILIIAVIRKKNQ
jgi:hypothetical protein